MNKLILLVALIFSNLSVFAEEDDVDIFIPDFNLLTYYDYKTYKDYTTHNKTLELSKGASYIGLQHKRIIGENEALLTSFKVANFGNADLSGVNNAREAWFGYSSDKRQVEIGILKNIETYLGGSSDDPLSNSNTNILEALLDQDTFVSGMGVSSEGVNYIEKDFIINNGDLIVEISSVGDMDSAPLAKVGYRISNDTEETVGGKVVGGDEVFILTEPKTGFRRVGARVTFGNLRLFAMKQSGGTGDGKKAHFGSAEYKITDGLVAVATAGESFFNSVGSHTKKSHAVALKFIPIKELEIVLGNKTVINGGYGSDNESYNASLSVAYKLGSVIK